MTQNFKSTRHAPGMARLREPELREAICEHWKHLTEILTRLQAIAIDHRYGIHGGPQMTLEAIGKMYGGNRNNWFLHERRGIKKIKTYFAGIRLK